MNADTSFPSVNLFWFAAVAASQRRDALGGTDSGTATAAFAVLRRAGQRRGYNIEEPEMVKAFAAGGERLSNSFRCLAQAPLHSAALWFVRDYLRRRFAHFKLRAHFLQARSKCLNLLLLLRDSCLQLLNFAIEHGLGLAAREIAGAR